MKRLFVFLLLCSFQLFSQSYLNILLSNEAYKNTQISQLEKISFSPSGDAIYFHLTDESVVSENTADVKSFLFSNVPLGNPMPVELVSFSAVQIGSSVLLNWSTETEVNNYGFEIERAIDSETSFKQWIKIGFVEGNGNCNSPKHYYFTDNPDVDTKYFYRLRQIDSDGQFQYSEIIFIDLNKLNDYTLNQNYPNPFNPTTTVKYSIPVDAVVKLKIYDVLGREISTLVNEFQKAGVYYIPFNAEELSSGIYFCKMNSGKYNSSVKMTLIK